MGGKAISKKLVFAIALILLALLAIYLLTKPDKEQDILANLDKTNYGANKPASSGLAAMLPALLAFL